MKKALRILINGFLKSLFGFALISLLGNVNAQTLKSLADAKGIYIGNIISNPLLDNKNHDGGKPDNIMRTEFNTAVLENYMKMNSILPNKPTNPFNFGTEALRKGPIDRFIKYCKKDDPNNQLRTRGHTMIWHSQAPGWLTSQGPGWTKQQVYDFSYHYIKALAQYCGEDMDEWDVINEVIAPDHFPNSNRTGGFRGNTWFRKAGSTEKELDDYFKFCFATAREFAPHAKLFYNDFSMERYSNAGSKNGRMRAFAARMSANNTEIDGIGFQCHFAINSMASGNNANMTTINGIKQTMEELDDLGFEVAITELDIRRCNGSKGTDAGRKAAFKEFAKMTLSQPNCNTFVLWGISDKDSWITLGHKPGCSDPLLYDKDFDRNSGYFGVREALQELTGGLIVTDILNSVTAPDVVKQSQVVTLNVNYQTSETRDIVVMFQLDESPWTLLEQVTTSVPAGKGSIEIEVMIPAETAVANDAYQFQTFLTPTGLGWDEKLDFFEIKDVDVLELEVKEPFTGTPLVIPGSLEIENYDKGGSGVSYFDGTPDNKGAQESGFRIHEGVDIGTGNGGNVLGWTSDDEWVEHTVNITQAGEYQMKITYSSKNGGGTFGMDMDGTEISTDVTIPSTSDWDSYSELVKIVNLPAGEHVLRFNIEKGGFNLDKIEFAKMAITSIDENVVSAFSVYPNPSQDGIYHLNKEYAYSIYNSRGMRVKEGVGSLVNLSNQEKGIYVLHVGLEQIKLMR